MEHITISGIGQVEVIRRKGNRITFRAPRRLELMLFGGEAPPPDPATLSPAERLVRILNEQRAARLEEQASVYRSLKRRIALARGKVRRSNSAEERQEHMKEFNRCVDSFNEFASRLSGNVETIDREFDQKIKEVEMWKMVKINDE